MIKVTSPEVQVRYRRFPSSEEMGAYATPLLELVVKPLNEVRFTQFGVALYDSVRATVIPWSSIESVEGPRRSIDELMGGTRSGPRRL